MEDDNEEVIYAKYVTRRVTNDQKLLENQRDKNKMSKYVPFLGFVLETEAKHHVKPSSSVKAKISQIGIASYPKVRENQKI